MKYVDVMTEFFFNSDIDNQTVNLESQVKTEMTHRSFLKHFAEYEVEKEKDHRICQITRRSTRLTRSKMKRTIPVATKQHLIYVVKILQ